MKKFLPAVALAVLTLTFQSCKKDNQQAEQVAVDQNGVVDSHEGHDHAVENAQEQLVQEAQSQPLTNLVLAENMYNFGDIKKGESKEHKYEVTNTGKNPLIISAVKPGCGCTAPDYTQTPIMPGQKGYITLKFDSSNFDGAIHKQAEVFANVEKSPIVIGFTGNVIP